MNKQKQAENQKIAIITGCNRGIGSGIRDSLLQEGYKVFGFNRTESEFSHIDYQEIICDLSKKNSIEQAVKILKKKTKMVNVLVHNAAIRRFGPIDTLNSEEWTHSIDTNLNGIFHLTQNLLPSIIGAEGYCIVVGSHAEKYTFAEGAAYCSTKAATRALSECLLEEVRHYGVKVSYLSIGAVKNRDHGYDESWKLMPKDIGDFIVSLLRMNPRVLASYIDLRPSQPLTESKKGIEKLQYM